MVQPASVDLRLGDSFRVFHNHRVDGDRPARPAERPDRAGRRRGRTSRSSSIPGEFCLGRTEEWVELPDDIVARIEGKSLARAPRADRPRDRRLLRPGLEGHADARAQQPHARPDQAVARPADRAALVHDARPRPPSARTATRSSAATTTARSRRPRAATRAARPRGAQMASGGRSGSVRAAW